MHPSDSALRSHGKLLGSRETVAMASQEEPLISGGEGTAEEDTLEYGTDSGELDPELPRPAPPPPGLFIWLLTFSAGISGLLFGCECPFKADPRLAPLI